MHFEVVHVGAVGVDLGTDRMPGAMYKIIAEASSLDGAADGLVHLVSGKGFSSSNGFLHEFRARITGIANRLKHFLHAVGWRLADEPCPRNVVVDRVRYIFFGPDIEQYKIAFADWSSVRAARPVMRIAAIIVYRHHWRIRGHQILAAKRFKNPLLNLKFISAAFASTAADFLECGGGYFIQRIPRGEVGFDLLFGQRG